MAVRFFINRSSRRGILKSFLTSLPNKLMSKAFIVFKLVPAHICEKASKTSIRDQKKVILGDSTK